MVRPGLWLEKLAICEFCVLQTVASVVVVKRIISYFLRGMHYIPKQFKDIAFNTSNYTDLYLVKSVLTDLFN